MNYSTPSSQYYDWDNNFCHRLDWMNDNSFTLIESDTEIPSEIDPSQLTNILDFEPEKLKALVRSALYNYSITINCILYCTMFVCL